MIKSEFKNQNDECIVSPKNCPDGISFSIWEKAMYSEDVLQVMADHERKYILSTGIIKLSKFSLISYIKRIVSKHI